MANSTTHNSSGLAQFLVKRYEEWVAERKRNLDPKLQANLNAVWGVDDTRKRPFKSGEGQGWRSDAYLPVARVKVFTAFAILQDVLLQGGRVPFSLVASPFEDESYYETSGASMEEVIEDMEDKIQEQLRDRNADREYLKKLLSMCVYGMAWSKYNVESVKRRGFARKIAHPGYGEQDAVVEFEQVNQSAMVPGHIYVSVWNMYWDMESEDLQTGNGVCERDMICAYDLRRLEKDENYITDNVVKVRTAAVNSGKSSPSTADDNSSQIPALREISNRKRNIRRLRFWGRAPRNLVEDFERDYMSGADGKVQNTPLNVEEEDSGDDIEVMAIVADDEVIRLERIESGMRPYKKCVWRVSLDEVTAMGVVDDVSEAGYILNGLTRAFLDNKRLSANVILAYKESLLADPSRLDEPVEPGMKLPVSDACDDARKALTSVFIPDTGATLLDAMGYFDRWKDTSSQLPEILQGSVLPKQKADTAYEVSQVQENAGRYLGMVFKNVDEAFIEPEITDIYTYNMINPDYKGKKGSYVVHAVGFPTFKDTLIRAQKIKELLVLVLSSPILAAEAKIRAFLDEILKNSDVDPDDFLKSEEDKKAEQDKQIEAEAQLRAAQDALVSKTTENKIAETTAATTAKATADRTLAEDAFQRDVIKEGIKAAQQADEAQGMGIAPPGNIGGGKTRNLEETLQGGGQQ